MNNPVPALIKETQSSAAASLQCDVLESLSKDYCKMRYWRKIGKDWSGIYYNLEGLQHVLFLLDGNPDEDMVTALRCYYQANY